MIEPYKQDRHTKAVPDDSHITLEMRDIAEFFHSLACISHERLTAYKDVVGQLTDLVSSRVVVMETTDIRKMQTA